MIGKHARRALNTSSPLWVCCGWSHWCSSSGATLAFTTNEYLRHYDLRRPLFLRPRRLLTRSGHTVPHACRTGPVRVVVAVDALDLSHPERSRSDSVRASVSGQHLQYTSGSDPRAGRCCPRTRISPTAYTSDYIGDSERGSVNSRIVAAVYHDMGLSNHSPDDQSRHRGVVFAAAGPLDAIIQNTAHRS